MKKWGRCAVGLAVVVTLLLAASVVPSQAGGSRVFVGVNVGVPLWGPVWGPPVVYPAPVLVAPPPIIVQSPPPPQTFVERQPPPPPQVQAQAQPSQFWYFCQDSQTYFPYVKECPSGWLQVVPHMSPPPTGAPAPSPLDAPPALPR
ncbi:MAG TPA: hypothetical protein VEL75_16515 [Candidatus Methylomirabilis sp.]|nr:hypothetical protein [Candidatus Methylomirabilis sp.]